MEYVDYLRKYLPEALILFDSTGNAMDTFLAAMVEAGDRPCVHMEDDIYITSNFMEKIEKALSERPLEVIQFFSMRGDDLKIGSRYDFGRTFMMNQCFYLPSGYSKMIYDYYPRWPQRDYHKTGYDILIADFLKERKEKYYIHVPSLVQHRNCKSIINPKRPRFRQSKTFVEGLFE
jgi:GR25 family glycosyltransferase involved in LPS biosynthesis